MCPASIGPHQGLRYGYTVGEDGWGPGMTADLKRIDALMLPVVKDRNFNTPPGSPSDGDRYILGGVPTGAWSGKARQIAVYDADSGSWLFYVPQVGWKAYVEADGVDYIWNGVSWNRAAWVNAARFANIQDAVDAVAAAGGGTVFIPAGNYHSATTPAFTTIVLPTTGSIHLRGEGGSSTRLINLGDAFTDLITIKGSNCAVSDLSILGGTDMDGSGSTSGGACVLIGDVTGNVISRIVLRDLEIFGPPRWGVYIAGQDSTGTGPYTEDHRSEAVGTHCTDVTLERVHVIPHAFTPATPANVIGVQVGWGCTTVRLIGCQLQSRGTQLFDFGTGTTCINTIFEQATEDAPFVRLGLCLAGKFYACWFESAWVQDGNGEFFIEQEGIVRGLTIEGCNFARVGDAGNVWPMIYKSSASFVTHGMVIANCQAFTAGIPTATDDLDFNHADDHVLITNCLRQDAGSTVAPVPWRISFTSGGAHVVQHNPQERSGLPQLTNTEMLALVDVRNGDLAYDVTNHKLNVYANGAWTAVH